MSSLRVLAATAAVGLAGAAQAAGIGGLLNTGQGLADNVVDTNYSFGVVAGTATGTACASASGLCGVVATTGWPIGSAWLADTAASHWLTPSSNEGQSYDPDADGTYTWTLKFDLTGYLPGTASFVGRFAADNSSTVRLNGGASLATAGGFGSWTSFSANSGFVAGVNTLEFLVTNDRRDGGNPTGLRVEFTESSVAVVPEPEGYALALVALGVLGVAGRRRRG